MILSDDVSFVGVDAKAGCGKTIVATGCADILVHTGKYDGMLYVFATPQEYKLGYRPGTQEQKESAYFEPLNDALYTLGHDPSREIVQLTTPENTKAGNAWIEARSTTFMRGINLANKVVVIDEAQNLTVKELKKLLTRVHDNSKIIMIGHSKQCDINEGASGFTRYLEHFASEPYFRRIALTINHRGRISTHADELEE